MSMDRVTDDPVNAYHRTIFGFFFAYVFICHLDVDCVCILISQNHMEIEKLLGVRVEMKRYISDGLINNSVCV